MRRLRDIKGEQAVDCLADLMEPLAEIATDSKVKEMWQDNTTLLLIVKYMLKEHKKAILTMLAILEGESVEQYMSHINPITLMMSAVSLFNDPDVQGLFQSQSQKTDEMPSGSATPSTEETVGE